MEYQKEIYNLYIQEKRKFLEINQSHDFFLKMPKISGVSQLTAPELVKSWKRLVNDNVMIGRDAHLLKEQLRYMTPAQLLYGIYQYIGNKIISIPQFLTQRDGWFQSDEVEAEIELAAAMSDILPPEYWIWQDLKNEQTNTYEFSQFQEAYLKLREWSTKVLA